MSEVVHREERYRIVGACFEVHNEKGAGFLEGVHQDCLEIEFEHQGIPAVREPTLELEYRGRPIAHVHRPDFICFRKIIVEVEAVSKLVDEHRSQILNYLNATRFQLGLLVNFGASPKLESERFVLTK